MGSVELLLRWGADEALVNQDGKTAADEVERWDWNNEEEDRDYSEEESDDEEDSDDDDTKEHRRKADDRRIRHMLVRAPADRLWRRRGWLGLARSHPDKVQIVNSRSSGDGDGSTKVAGRG